mgnify:CR=1 FL=1
MCFCDIRASKPPSWKFAGPLALGVSDPKHESINQWINEPINPTCVNQSMNQWTNQPINPNMSQSINEPSNPRPYIVFWKTGRASRGPPRGAAPDQLLGSIGVISKYNFVWKSLPCLMQFVFNVWSIWAAKLLPTSAKINKNVFQNRT